MNEWGPIIRLISDGGTIGLLVAILIGGAKKWWVWGWYAKQVEADRDEWKALALHGVTTAETGMTLAQALAGRRLRRRP